MAFTVKVLVGAQADTFFAILSGALVGFFPALTGGGILGDGAGAMVAQHLAKHHHTLRVIFSLLLFSIGLYMLIQSLV